MHRALATMCFLGILPLNAFAGDQTGLVKEIRVSSKGAVFGNPTHVLIEGPWNARPSCAVAWWAIDTDTVNGKNMLATLLTAKLSGKTVTLWGVGACTLRGDMEDAHQAGITN